MPKNEKKENTQKTEQFYAIIPKNLSVLLCITDEFGTQLLAAKDKDEVIGILNQDAEYFLENTFDGDRYLKLVKVKVEDIEPLKVYFDTNSGK